MSKLYIAALNCYRTKVYQWLTVRSKCQVTAHRLWYVAKQGLSVYTLQKGNVTIAENGSAATLGITACKLTRNTAWLVKHSPYLQHLINS